MEIPSTHVHGRGENVIHVVAPARLHLGFIDMHGGMGRSFGSLGLSLADICTRISARPAENVFIQGPSSQRASLYAGRILDYLGVKTGVNITIHEAIPEHAGLGSGTQLSLAIGAAIARVYGFEVSIRKIAYIMERGARSGIGVGAFTQGGFLVDGGMGDHTDIPPIICHLPFPEAWRFVLVFDNARQGIHDQEEKAAFASLQPMTETVAEHLCRLTLMQALPALVENDCERFGSAITEIQTLVGDHFARLQGGRYCSKAVASALTELQELGAAGFGQSSWGPTGFALFANETQAYQALRQLRERWSAEAGLSFRICRANNQEASIRTEEADLSLQTMKRGKS